MALGGVATGSINAQDAATAINALRMTAGIPRFSAMAANTGTNSAALAVLLANSVKNTTNATNTPNTKITPKSLKTVEKRAKSIKVSKKSPEIAI